MTDLPKRKVLVPIADGTEEIEAVCIIDVLRRAITPQDGVTSTIYDENIDILPANPSLESMAKTQINDRLAKVVGSLATSYGWIIIDSAAPSKAPALIRIPSTVDSNSSTAVLPDMTSFT
mgnify:CR=1 FL=1